MSQDGNADQPEESPDGPDQQAAGDRTAQVLEAYERAFDDEVAQIAGADVLGQEGVGSALDAEQGFDLGSTGKQPTAPGPLPLQLKPSVDALEAEYDALAAGDAFLDPVAVELAKLEESMMREDSLGAAASLGDPFHLPAGVSDTFPPQGPVPFPGEEEFPSFPPLPPMHFPGEAP